MTTNSLTNLRSYVEDSTIYEDLIIYVELSGDDVTGDGTITTPFATPHRALAWLADKKIADAEVTIQIGIGQFNFTEPITIDHKDANKLNILGSGLVNGVKPTEVWYVPTEGAYPGIGSTIKYVVSQKPNVSDPAFVEETALDFPTNKSLVDQEYHTVLNFAACNGFDIQDVYLKQIDKMAIIGDNGDNIDTYTHHGINVGHNSIYGETTPKDNQIKGGGFNLGVQKDVNEVHIMGFDSGGIKFEMGSGGIIGNVTVGHCNVGVNTKGTIIHNENITIFGCRAAMDISHEGQIINSDIASITGCYQALYVLLAKGQIGNAVRGVHSLIGAHKNATVLTYIDWANSVDIENVLIWGHNLDLYFSSWQLAPYVDNNVIINNKLKGSSGNNNIKVRFDNRFTKQNIIDMNWDVGVDLANERGLEVHSFYSTVKDFTAKAKTETSLATYTPDLSQDNYFEYTLTEATTIINPTTESKGHQGKIVIRQDATGGWVTTFGTDYINLPTLDTTANAWNVLNYTVLDTNKILLELVSSFV